MMGTKGAATGAATGVEVRQPQTPKATADRKSRRIDMPRMVAHSAMILKHNIGFEIRVSNSEGRIWGYDLQGTLYD